MISVIMSVYNETVDQLEKAIDSIMQQTLPASEFIIVLDNPKRSDLKEVLQGYAAKFKEVFLICNQTNIGLARSLNKAANQAKGVFLARMDADDIALPKRFEIEMGQLDKHPEWSLVSGNINYIDENDKITGTKSAIPESAQVIARILPLGSVIIHPTVIMRKKVFEQVGGYRELPTAEDYDLWLRMLDSGGKLGAVNKQVLDYRIRNNSMTSNAWKTDVVTRYIQRLAKERSQEGMDAFEKENGVSKNIYDEINDINLRNKFNTGQDYFVKGISMIRKGKIQGILLVMQCIFTSKQNRMFLVNYLKLRLKYMGVAK